MKAVMHKWGKEISYSVSNDASWMVVDEAPFTWIYVTKKDIDDADLNMAIRQSGVRPDFVKRRGMMDLMIHFGVDSETRNKLFDNNDAV